MIEVKVLKRPIINVKVKGTVLVDGGHSLSDIRIGHGLKLEKSPEGDVLSVNTAPSVEKDNTLPVTSAAVYMEVGNINALLETI